MRTLVLVLSLTIVTMFRLGPAHAESVDCEAARCALLAEIDAECPCAEARNHGRYLTCVARVVNRSVALGNTPKACRNMINGCFIRSLCGKREKIVLCNDAVNGRCRPLLSDQCVARHGTEVSTCCAECGEASPTPTPSVATPTRTPATPLASATGQGTPTSTAAGATPSAGGETATPAGTTTAAGTSTPAGTASAAATPTPAGTASVAGTSTPGGTSTAAVTTTPAATSTSAATTTPAATASNPAGATPTPAPTGTAALPVATATSNGPSPTSTPAAGAETPTPSTTPFTLALSVLVDGDPTDGPPPLSVHLTSDVEDGTPPYTYAWDFGDGSPTSSDPNPTHVYTQVGDFTATLVVTDAGGDQDSDYVDVSVGD